MNKKVLYVIIGVLILILLAGLVFIFVMANSEPTIDENETTTEDNSASEMSTEEPETIPVMDEQEEGEEFVVEVEASFVETEPSATVPPVTEPPITEPPITEPSTTETPTISDNGPVIGEDDTPDIV